jgi:hypothetical protein
MKLEIHFILMILNYVTQTYKHPALYHSHIQPSIENTFYWCLQITTYAINNLKIVIYAIHLSIYQTKTCISFTFSNSKKYYGGSWTKSLQSFPLTASVV